MRVLLDTNIIIHREASTVVKQEIGVLFNWLDKLRYTKCVHPLTLSEIKKHKDPKVVATLSIKLGSYVELKTEAPESPEIARLRLDDQDENSKNDTSVIKEVFSNRVDLLITEDRGIHRKAKTLGIDSRVFTIDGFVEKVTAENPNLVDYKVLAVRQSLFGQIDVSVPFFDSFRRDYAGFDSWFNRKADETCYVCSSDTGDLQAFLYLKIEDRNEPYHDIEPSFAPKKRLKIGTFKVNLNGFKLGERFLKIVFDNAVAQDVAEIYVTVFDKDTDQQRLIGLLMDWGFVRHGKKIGKNGDEIVLVRDFTHRADAAHPNLTFPYMSGAQRKFIVPIYPAYHTELLPDSILRNEDPENFEGNRPNRNALRKVYISRSIRRDMKPGDILVFYRTAAKGKAAYYTSVATTLGVVERVITKIGTLDQFIGFCRKRSVFSDAELAKHWNYSPNNRPFVVNFLHTLSFPKRPNLKTLIDEHIIAEAPRGFELISDEAFSKLLTLSHANQSLIVH
jgi:predicted nucleic acid-binding protein